MTASVTTDCGHCGASNPAISRAEQKCTTCEHYLPTYDNWRDSDRYDPLWVREYRFANGCIARVEADTNTRGGDAGLASLTVRDGRGQVVPMDLPDVNGWLTGDEINALLRSIAVVRPDEIPGGDR